MHIHVYVYKVCKHMCTCVWFRNTQTYGKIKKKCVGMTEHEFRIVDPSQGRETWV